MNNSKGTIKMLNLFRCSSTVDRVSHREQDYFITDYFDGIRVDALDWKDTTLAECMGIARKANDKIGVSHQRYCLYGQEDDKGDIFDISEDFPVLTVIQIFINPDLYQAKCFEDGRDISGNVCMDRLQKCIDSNYSRNDSIQWKLYNLLTAGDFAVIVRSKKVHDAYDITTLIRSIRILVDKEGHEDAAFYTYSISGIVDKIARDSAGYAEINWTDFLDERDEVIVRLEFSQTFRGACVNEESAKMKRIILEQGERLFGRYDHQISCNSKEFQEMYPYIRTYKFEKQNVQNGTCKKEEKELCKPELSEKAEAILWMIREGHLSQINEKLLLRYVEDDILIGGNAVKWGVICDKKWESLYKRNSDKITEMKEKVNEIEKDVESLFTSARNMKEYMRLAGRLCRVFYEINQLQELRISMANLLKQFEVLLLSLEKYIDYTKDWDRKSVADAIQGYLQRGIGALEIFTRYIRNVNLQTLQTPNYDLQTNVCIEKVLLAYSQFLRPFMQVREKPYFLFNTLYPIVVPNMSELDLAVTVLFDDDHKQGGDGKENKKLMVVYSPTFINLCETCFFMPVVFHEIAHQFRYEERNKRNECLIQYILKSFIWNMLRHILDETRQYVLDHEEMSEALVDKIYDKMSERFHLGELLDENLQNLKYRLGAILEEYVHAVVDKEKSPDTRIREYIKKTKGNIQEFDSEIQERINDIKILLEATATQESDHSEQSDILKLKTGLKELRDIQERQLSKAIRDVLKQVQEGMDRSDSCDKIQKFLETTWSEGNNLAFSDKGREAFELWNGISPDIHNRMLNIRLNGLLKQYHNLNLAYEDCYGKLESAPSVQTREYQQFFSVISEIISDEILNELQKFQLERRNRLIWDTVPMPSNEMEYIKKKIKVEKHEGMERRIEAVYQTYGVNKLKEHVYSIVEYYREITSDLFMCGIMDLDLFGYMVVVAENFNFRKNNRDALQSRVFAVLQCISRNTADGELTAVKFDEGLLSRLREELRQLNEGLNAGRHGGNQKIYEWDKIGISDMKEFIDSIKDREYDCNNVDLTSTQKWIIRIYRQIVYLAGNLLGSGLAQDAIGEKDMWRDISESGAYYEKRERLQEELKNNGDYQLCNDISKILNSPATYFKEKKSLLTKEIEFILKHYEENCKQIWL